MAPPEHGIEYAVHIITNHFGNLVSKVCESLLRKGPLTLQRIVQFTAIKVDRAKDCLLVLIQHNCVQAFSLEEPGHLNEGSKFTTQYMALFDNILHRMRFSKFIAMMVEPEYDKQCVQLLYGLFQHGRLNLKQMVGRAEGDQTEGNGMVDAVLENLRKLVEARFVERCPAAEPVIALPTEEEENAAKKQRSKSAKMILLQETLEQRVLTAAMPMEAKRYSVDISAIPDDAGDNNKSNYPGQLVGEKRKHGAMESYIDGGDTDEQVTLWRPNFEEFIRRLRHKACVGIVRATMDDSAAIVISAMLDASRSEEQKVRTGNSVPLSVNSIYQEVIKSEKGRNMTVDHVRAALDQLTSPSPFVRVVDESYSIDFAHIIEVGQREEVESIVFKRYGKDAYRMFRLLLKAEGLLETDKISDTAFVDKKETTKVLYRMWRDGYLIMEKVVAGMTPFLLWKVNKRNLWGQVLDEMFHASLNLSIRFAYEEEQRKEAAAIPPEKRVGAAGEKYEKLRNLRFLLDSARLNLDDAIMLFHDF